MRAVRFHGRMDIRIDEVEEPDCGHNQVKACREFAFHGVLAFHLKSKSSF